MSNVYTGASAGIIGQAEAQFQSNKSTGKSSLGKDDFLTLLFAQLQNQDPLNPQDDKDFTAQLSQFSSLEQLTNISSGIDKLNSATTQQQMFSAVGFMGKQIKAKGGSLAKSGDSVSALYYTLPQAATKVSINIMDTNGNIVRTVDQGGKAAGEQSFQWDGKDSNGNKVADGTYTVGITCENAAGTPMLVNTTVTGLVSGVSTDATGAYVLSTQDGRAVYLTDVQGIVTPSTSTQ
jgi:flagellar basal-body rod modification protein FlgD